MSIFVFLKSDVADICPNFSENSTIGKTNESENLCNSLDTKIDIKNRTNNKVTENRRKGPRETLEARINSYALPFSGISNRYLENTIGAVPITDIQYFPDFDVNS
ncbi:MAG: hypothetical protein Q7T03_03095 [Deltaproteobacteria bacterium]|nr:hypothetical protein [Deltaproteobacteria bacterium]